MDELNSWLARHENIVRMIYRGAVLILLCAIFVRAGSLRSTVDLYQVERELDAIERSTRELLARTPERSIAYPSISGSVYPTSPLPPLPKAPALEPSSPSDKTLTELLEEFQRKNREK